MEQLYSPDKILCTENKNLKEYFTKFSALVNKNLTAESNKNKNKVMKPHEIEELEQATSLDLLFGFSNASGSKMGPEPATTPILRTTQVRNTSKNRTSCGQFTQLESIVSNTENCEDIKSFKFESGNEFALHVRIHHPFEFNYNCQRPNGYQNIKFSHEIVVLGSNTLAELRDKILCFNDTGIFPEVEDPFAPLPPTLDAKKEYPSGFIFIDNVFYNDLRDPNSKDYSGVIREWAIKNKIEPLHVATMDETRIDQLTPRLGYPYVYLHQGKCEHLLVFTDAWLVTNANLKLSDYPRYHGVNRFHSKLCILCNTELAQWMVLHCLLLPRSRSFLCTQCMYTYLYKDGQKLGEFKLFQFYDRNKVI